MKRNERLSTSQIHELLNRDERGDIYGSQFQWYLDFNRELNLLSGITKSYAKTSELIIKAAEHMMYHQALKLATDTTPDYVLNSIVRSMHFSYLSGIANYSRHGLDYVKKARNIIEKVDNKTWSFIYEMLRDNWKFESTHYISSHINFPAHEKVIKSYSGKTKVFLYTYRSSPFSNRCFFLRRENPFVSIPSTVNTSPEAIDIVSELYNIPSEAKMKLRLASISEIAYLYTLDTILEKKSYSFFMGVVLTSSSNNEVNNLKLVVNGKNNSIKIVQSIRGDHERYVVPVFSF